MRRLFGCPDIVSLTEKFLMARNFYRIFTENNPVIGDSKTFGIPEAKGLMGPSSASMICYIILFISMYYCNAVKLVIFARVIFRAQPPYRHIRGLLLSRTVNIWLVLVQQYAHDVVDMYLPLHNGFINGCTYTLGTSSWSLRGQG